jgi:hypothetical protein
MSKETYTGGCQCGAVRFEAEIDLSHTVTCNCSRCQRLGSVLAFAPRESFHLLSGTGSMTEYLFNKHQIRHLFCKTCGIQSFSYGQMPDGTPMVAVNANCLDGIEPRQLHSQHFDGRSL